MQKGDISIKKMEKVYKCTKIGDFFKKKVEQPKSVGQCKLCHTLGANENVCLENCKNLNENEHTKMHGQQLQLISNSTNYASGKKTSSTAVHPSKVNGKDTNRLVSSVKIKNGNGQQRVEQKKRKLFKEKNSKIDRKSKTILDKGPLALIRRSHCWKLSAKFQNSHKVECQLCRNIVGFDVGKNDLPSRLVEHVLQVHLKKPSLVCRRYKAPCKNRSNSTDRVKVKHGAYKSKGNYEDYSNRFHQETMSALDQCFDYSGKSGDSAPAASARRRTIGNCSIAVRVRPLIKGRIQNNHLTCFECGSTLKVKYKTEKGVALRCVIRHATAHMKTFLFECRLCKYRAYTKSNIQKHLSNWPHGLGKSFGKYIDLTADHKDEIIEMVQRCFGQKEKQPEKGGTATKHIWARGHEKKLA